MRRLTMPFLPLLLLTACGASSAAPVGLATADSSAIRALQDAYVRAWLADDTLGVLATFADDAMLIPPGHEPVVGKEAIRAYWWPQDGSHTTIRQFTLTVDEIDGGGSLAFTRGFSTLDWVYQRDTLRQESTGRNASLTLLRRQPDGQWRISRQIWGTTIQ